MLYNCTMLHVAKIKCVRFGAAASCFPSEIKKKQQKKTKYICVRRWSWTAAASNPSFPLSAAGWCLLTESRKPHFFWSCRMFSHDTHQGKSRISSWNTEKVWAVFFFSFLFLGSVLISSPSASVLSLALLLWRGLPGVGRGHTNRRERRLMPWKPLITPTASA